MKTLSSTVKTNLASGVTTLARLVQFDLINGSHLYFTDADRNITFGGNVYRADNGCQPSQVQLVLGTTAQSCSVDVLIDPAGVTASMIESGSLDDARMSVIVVDYTDLSWSLLFFKGFVSRCVYKDRITATIDGQPLLARSVPLAQDKYSSNCRADLGDGKCKFDIESLAVTATISSSADLQSFVCTDYSVTHGWRRGLVVFTSGVNSGSSFEIAESDNLGNITLKGLMPFEPSLGDGIKLYLGCDKTLATCRDIYNNVLNFRGEPFSIAPFVITPATAPAPTPSATTAVPATPSPTPDVVNPYYVHTGPWLVDGQTG